MSIDIPTRSGVTWGEVRPILERRLDAVEALVAGAPVPTVPTFADLPEPGSGLRITQDDLHLWVWEDSVPGWTDLGSLKGENGAPGSLGGITEVAPGAYEVEGLGADTGWVTLSGGTRVRRLWNIVHVNYYGNLPAGTGTVDADTLPVGYRPGTTGVGIYFAGSTSNPPGRVHLLASGTVRYYAVPSTGSFVTMSGSFITDDPYPSV